MFLGGISSSSLVVLGHPLYQLCQQKKARIEAAIHNVRWTPLTLPSDFLPADAAADGLPLLACAFPPVLGLFGGMAVVGSGCLLAAGAQGV